MTAARLYSVTVSGPDRYEITFELPDGPSRTFACRVVDVGTTTVWERRFDELVGGRDAHLKHELSWLVSYFHLVRQTAWACPPALTTPRPPAGRRPARTTRSGRRPTYPLELQADAVEMARSGEYTGGEVADAVGCSLRQLRRWLRREETIGADVGESSDRSVRSGT